jgi:hypothetical protein
MKQVHGVIGNRFGLEKKNPPSLYLSSTEHKAYVLDRSDILDIGNKNIVLYRIEFMPAIHRPTNDIAKVKGFNISRSKTKVTRSNLLIPTQRPYHQKQSCEISKS